MRNKQINYLKTVNKNQEKQKIRHIKKQKTKNTYLKKTRKNKKTIR